MRNVLFYTFGENFVTMKWVSAFMLVISLLVTGRAQEKDIEVFEKKEGNKNIVMARNIGKVAYLVTIKIKSTGMDVTPGMNVESVVPAGFMKEMATLVPRPGESWTYGYDVSFTESTGPAPNATSTPLTQTKQQAPTANNTAAENPKTTAAVLSTAPLSTAPLIVYTQAGCGRCSYVKKELTAKGIAYQEVDVNSGSPDATNMWKQLRDGGFTGDSVTMPVVKVNGQLHYNIKDLAGFVNGIKL